MEITKNKVLQETVYKEEMENGLKVIIVPKKEFAQKYVMWSTHYGSIDNSFVVPGEKDVTKVPDGIAHFLEHKLFEQENGTNSLDTLTALGASANAYTTFNHTAYLFECTDNFEESLDELMDYVQNPYFTDENVEKEKGIIGQEIMMYDDSPEWRLYMQFLESAYYNIPINKDIAGTVESISKIDKEVLYKCYNTFYHPSNMVMIFVGNFEAEDIIAGVKKRLKPKEKQEEIQRITETEPENVKNNKVAKKMEVSMPMFLLGYKLKPCIEKEEQIKTHVAIEILLEIIAGKSSPLYQELYEKGLVMSEFGLDYDFEKSYAYITIDGQSKNPDEVIQKIQQKIDFVKANGIDENTFKRIKNVLHGEYVKQFNDVGKIARMFVSDYFKGVDTLDYIKIYENIDKEYVLEVLKDVFDKEKSVISLIEPQDN